MRDWTSAVNWNWLLDAVNHLSADDDGAKGTGRGIYISIHLFNRRNEHLIEHSSIEKPRKRMFVRSIRSRSFSYWTWVVLRPWTMHNSWQTKCVHCWSFVGCLSLHRIFVLIRPPILLLSRMTRVRFRTRSVVASVKCRRVQLIVNYGGVSFFLVLYQTFFRCL